MASFSQTKQEIVKRAMRICGRIAAGQEPRTEDFNAASDCLNSLNEDLHNEGVFLWQRNEFDITTVASTASYTIADTYEGVESARIVKTDEDWPIKPITNSEYVKITDKDYEGDPYKFKMGNELSSQTITFWPVPDAVMTIRCVGVLLHPTMTSNSDTPDFPPNWLNVLTFGTAYYYAMECQLDERRVSLLESQYNKFLAKAKRRKDEEVEAIVENAFENTYE